MLQAALMAHMPCRAGRDGRDGRAAATTWCSSRMVSGETARVMSGGWPRGGDCDDELCLRRTTRSTRGTSLMRRCRTRRLVPRNADGRDCAIAAQASSSTSASGLGSTSTASPPKQQRRRPRWCCHSRLARGQGPWAARPVLRDCSPDYTTSVLPCRPLLRARCYKQCDSIVNSRVPSARSSSTSSSPPQPQQRPASSVAASSVQLPARAVMINSASAATSVSAVSRRPSPRMSDEQHAASKGRPCRRSCRAAWCQLLVEGDSAARLGREGRDGQDGRRR